MAKHAKLPKEKPYAITGVNPIDGWTENQLVGFWDGLIRANLTHLRDYPSERKDIYEWLHSEYFEVACAFARLDADRIRDIACRCVNIDFTNTTAPTTKIKNENTTSVFHSVMDQLDLF